MKFSDALLLSLLFAFLIYGIALVFDSFRQEKWLWRLLGLMVIFVQCVGILARLTAMGVFS